jgi:cell division protein FtsA
VPGTSPIVAIEIGTTKVRVLVAEAREDGHLMITGIGEQASRGIRKGEIVHFDNALTSVKAALDEAETQSRVSIHEVNIILSGGHIQCLVNRGAVPIMGDEREIVTEDVRNAINTAKAVSIPPEREIIHSIQQHFFVDEQPGVVDPEGMEGSKLSVDMLMLHGVRTRLLNILRLVKTAQVEFLDRAFGGLFSSLAVLTPEQKEHGAIVIDIGGGTTDYFVYANKKVALAGTLALGGDHITNDLALGLRVPTSQAERLKIQFGSAMVDLTQREQTVTIPPEGGFTGGQVKVVDVQTIINARVDEIFHMIEEKLVATDLIHHIGAGVILTGGTARLRRLDDLAGKIFNVPCRLGKPRDVSGLAVATEGCEFAAPIGLLRFAEKTGRKSSATDGLVMWVKGLIRK